MRMMMALFLVLSPLAGQTTPHPSTPALQARKAEDRPLSQIPTISLLWSGSRPDVQCELGMRYLAGDGVDKDESKAFKKFESAAFQGHGKAQYQLALCFLDGKGVTQDWSEAYIWSSIAGTMGVTEAKKLRDGLASKLSTEAIEKAQQVSKQRFAKVQEAMKQGG